MRQLINKFYFLVLSIVFVIPLRAQIFNPINWKSESILWSTYTRNPDLETPTLRPRMRFDYHNLPLFHNGYMYQIANNFDYAFSGYFIQKINLATGEEICQKNRFFERNQREYAVSPYINEEKFGFGIFKEIPLNVSVWTRSTIGVTEYDLVDCENSLYEITSREDPKNRQLFSGAPGTGRHTFVYRKNSTVEYLMMVRKCPQECTKFSLEKYTLNENGHTLDSIENEIEFDYWINRTQVYKILDDKYIALVETRDPVNRTLYKIHSLLIDNDMNVIENNDITNFIENYTSLQALSFYHNGITNDKFNLYGISNTSKQVIYTFDTRGKLWEKIELPASETALSISLPMHDMEGSVVAISDWSETEPTTIKIYLSDGKGNLTLKEDLITDNPDDRFGVKAMFWTPDRNLLLHINQIHVSQIPLFVRQDYHCNALLDTRKLDIISNTVDNVPYAGKKVYPNPANNHITILEYQGTFNFEIYDMMGRLVLHSTTSTNGQIDISSLSTGLYNIRVLNGKKTENLKFVKQ